MEIVRVKEVKERGKRLELGETARVDGLGHPLSDLMPLEIDAVAGGPVLQRALRYAPAAALSALVMPDLLIDAGEVSPLNPKFAAGLVVLGVALRWRNPWLPFIIGMGVLLALRKGMGW